MTTENETVKKETSRWSGAFFSAKFLFLRALAIGALFLLVQLAGLREYTTFLSGTSDSPDVSLRLSTFYGLIYLVLYMGSVVLAPILLLAAALLSIWERKQRMQSLAQV